MSEVTFQQLKKWTKVFGIKSFGMRRDDMYAALVKEMKKKKDDLTETQLEWLAEQLGEKTPGKKTLKKKVVEEPEEEKPKKKLLKKKVVEEPEEEEKPKKKPLKKKAAKEEEEVETGVKVKIEKKDMKGFAKELGLEKYKPVTDEDYHALAQVIYEAVDEMEPSDREDLSKPLFKFYTNIKRQTVAEESEASEAEEAPSSEAKELPSTIKLKQWGHLLGLKVKGKADEEVAQAILDKYDELEDEEKEDLPKSLREWVEGVNLVEEAPEAEEDQVELPDIKTLKVYAKAVGLSIKDTMKAKGNPEAIAQMIVDAYDPNSEDEYPEEVKEFYAVLTGGATTEAEPEEVNEEEMFANWLVETGFDEEDVKTLDKDEMVDLLKSNYEDEDSRADLPAEAVEYLKETFPEMFEPPAKKKLLKKKIKK